MLAVQALVLSEVDQSYEKNWHTDSALLTSSLEICFVIMCDDATAAYCLHEGQKCCETGDCALGTCPFACGKLVRGGC